MLSCPPQRLLHRPSRPTAAAKVLDYPRRCSPGWSSSSQSVYTELEYTWPRYGSVGTGLLLPGLPIPHPTASSCRVVSMDEGLKDGQALYLLFSEKARNLPSQNLLTRPFQGHGKACTQCSEGQMFPQLLSEAKVYPYLS